MKKNLYIIGARGFGREIATALLGWCGFCDKYEIRGFLDDKADALDGFEGYPPIVSSVEDFRPGPNDVVLCALGAVEWRRKYIGICLDKQAQFDTFIDPVAYVVSSRIGRGCLILGNATISTDVTIGDFVLCHQNVVVGHDCVVGDYSVLENGVICLGGVTVGESATLHTRAVVLPHWKVGREAVVGACSCVTRNVKPGSTVFGVPAQRIDG